MREYKLGIFALAALEFMMARSKGSLPTPALSATRPAVCYDSPSEFDLSITSIPEHKQ